MKTLILNPAEVIALFEQDPKTKNKGGWQSFLVQMQSKCDQETGKITLSDEEMEKIPRYAFDMGSGGFQTRLLTIFQRTLGPKLGR